MNIGSGYSRRYFETKNGWVCVIHEHGADFGPRKRKGVATGTGRRKEVARRACDEAFMNGFLEEKNDASI